jgi:hypothetical protein
MLVEHASLTGETHAFDHAGQALAKTRRIDELFDLLALSGNPQDHSTALADAVARAIDARHCTIVFLGDDSHAYTAGESRSPMRAPEACSLGIVASILCERRIAGFIEARRSDSEPAFTEDDRNLVAIVACSLGHALRAAHLGNLLNSRFARVALADGGRGDAVNAEIGSVMFPDRMVRLLARSFYREMRKAGFGPPQIIKAASEIISELTQQLRQQGRERGVEAQPVGSKECVVGDRDQSIR